MQWADARRTITVNQTVILVAILLILIQFLPATAAAPERGQLGAQRGNGSVYNTASGNTGVHSVSLSPEE